MLEGKTVNLRVLEKDDVDFVASNDSNRFWEEYNPVDEQRSKSEWTKLFDNIQSSPNDLKVFIIQKKDGTKIGDINHRFNLPYKWMEIGWYNIIPTERGRGYGTEAVQLMIDYLFLSKDLGRIQAIVDLRNKASQRVLEKVGFQREGTIRKCLFNRGEWRDYDLYSILRE